MTRVLDIPETQWLSLFDVINGIAAGRPVRLEVVERGIGDQEMSRRMPLRGIEFERDPATGGELVISVGEDGGEMTRLIERPLRMAVGLSEGAEPEWICILEAEGGVTIIHFERLLAIEAEVSP